MVEESDVDVVYGHRVHPVLHLLSPVATIAVVWGTREVIDMTYRRVTGRTPPTPNDLQTPWRRALVWTAVTTTSVAVVEVTVRRLAAQRHVVGFRRTDTTSD